MDPEKLFVLTEEEELFRNELRERLSKDKKFQSIIERAKKTTDFDAALFWEAFNFFKSAGYAAYGMPEEYGGWVGSSRGSIILTEELCRFDGGIGLSLGATISLAASPIAIFGTDEQKAKWLPLVTSGKVIGCYCQSEPEAGSDVASIKTTAVCVEGRWVINGQKHFITNGSEAHLGLVVARVGPSRHRGLAVFIVDLARAKAVGEVTILRNEKKAGLQLSPTTAMSFDNCIAESVLGSVQEDPQAGLVSPEGWTVINSTLVGSRATAISAQGLGVVRGALQEAKKYASSRTQFDMLLSDMPRQRARILRVEAALKMGELLAWRAALMRDALGKVDSRPWQREASFAKLWCSELAEWGTSEMMQLCGGVGYTNPNIYKYWHDGRIVKIYEGTSDIQMLIIIGETLNEGRGSMLPFAFKTLRGFLPRPLRSMSVVLVPVSGVMRTIAGRLLIRKSRDRDVKHLLGRALDEFPIDLVNFKKVRTFPAVYFPIAEAIAACAGAELVGDELAWRRTAKREIESDAEAIAQMSVLLAEEKIAAARTFLDQMLKQKALRRRIESK